MKLWKKVSAMVAMAAVCMTMSVPVVASAEVDEREECVVHDWQFHMEENVISVHNHAYEVGLCVRTEMEVITYTYCNVCKLKTNEEKSYIIMHSECGAVE